jgi:prepilin-type N-terminal cleavage/methylation domain-containing protein
VSLSYRKFQYAKDAGFTLIELMVVMVITGMMLAAMAVFFKTSLFGYLDMQKTASNFTDLATQSQRIAKVIRGATDIIDPQNNSLELYAYFWPQDSYVSKVKYYLSADSMQLLVDVTPMTANPPIGTPITAGKKTSTVIGSFKQQSGVNLFQYVNSAGSVLTPPITEENTIKTVRINLAASASASGNQIINLEVNLRNRKTNL